MFLHGDVTGRDESGQSTGSHAGQDASVLVTQQALTVSGED